MYVYSRECFVKFVCKTVKQIDTNKFKGMI